MAGRQPMKTIGNTMTKKRVADVLVDTVIAVDVKRVYELVGDSLNGGTESTRPRKDLQWVPVRHEETAAFAAGAEAHLPDN
jgi:pyruvate dehydrogenase (quinone)